MTSLWAKEVLIFRKQSSVDKSLDVEDIRKSRHVKDFLYNVIDVADDHLAGFDHFLIGGEEDAEACGGDVVQFRKIEGEFGDAIQ